MKKIISFVLAVALLFSLAVPAFAAEPVTVTLSADNGTVAPGGEVTLTLSIDQPLTNIGAMQYDLSFNADLFSYKEGAAGNAFTGTTVGSPSTETGTANISIWYTDTAIGDPFDIDAGTIATLTFTANSEVTDATGAFSIVVKQLYDNDTFEDISNTVVNNASSITIAEASAKKYAITTSETANGTIIPNVNGIAVTEAAEGEKVTLTVTPADGYMLDTLTYTPAAAEGQTAQAVDIKATKSFTMPAAAVAVNATFKEIEEGYTVSIGAAEGPITAGQTVEIPVTVGHTDESVGAYNAYQLKLSYEEGLNFVKAEGSGVTNDSFEAEHDSENRTIQIVGYGADKTMAQNPVKLTFSGSTVGTHDVTLESAYVDAAGKANVQDAPEATVLQAVTSVQVNGFTVSLGTGLTADSLVAENGKEYTFRATDYSNYDYVITAKIGETAIPVQDNQDGNYTIEGKYITGNISITAAMTPKSYDVYVDEVKQSEKATYTQEFSVTPKKDGYTATAATVTIGGDPYTSHTFTDGTVTIPGKDIKGEIRITITWEQNTTEEEKVTVEKDDNVISGNKQTDKNKDYIFSLVDTENYEYDLSTLKVTIGEGENAKEYGKDDLTYDEATSQFTIPGNLVTGPITITVSRTEKNPVNLQVSEYLSVQAAEGETQNGTSIWLVTVSDVPEGSVAKYDGKNMFWSALTETTKVDEATGEETKTTTGYGAFAYLVISDQGQTAVEAEAKQKVSVAALAENETFVTVDYSGNVNNTNKVDVNDAQLTYNMYNAAYNSFDEENGGVSMEKFLRADLINDKTVDTKDAAAVVAAILAQQQSAE